VVVFCDVVVS